MKILGIIPARFASSRFPGKPLVDIHGKSMIERVILQALQAKKLDGVLVATDDERIYSHVQKLGHPVVMTRPDHPSGTDRCLEAFLVSGSDAQAVINIQGDEPFVNPLQIDQLAELIAQPHCPIATTIKKITDFSMLADPNKVKAVLSRDQRVLYFSRQAIPHLRGVDPSTWADHFDYWKHLGLYAYKTEVLKTICSLPPSPLEKAEALEQLRWLENGHPIYACITETESPAIDTPEDLLRVLKAM